VGWVTTSEYPSLYVFDIFLLCGRYCKWYLCYSVRVTFTYDHRLKRIGHPVRSAIHKLAYPLDNSLNRANRYSAESRLLAA
jgi:hypothetical protein